MLTRNRIKMAEVRKMAQTVTKRLTTDNLLEATKQFELELTTAMETQEVEEMLPLMHSIAAYIGESLVQRWGIKWQQKDLCTGFPSLKWTDKKVSMNLMPMLWVMSYVRAKRSIVLNVANVPRFLATEGEFVMPSEMLLMFEYMAAGFYELSKISPLEEDAEAKVWAYLEVTQETWSTDQQTYAAIKHYGSFLSLIYKYKYKYNGAWHFDETSEAYGVLTEDGQFIDALKKIENFVQKIRTETLLL